MYIQIFAFVRSVRVCEKNENVYNFYRPVRRSRERFTAAAAAHPAESL